MALWARDCPPGGEQYEVFRSPLNGARLVQYDYRAPNGALFTCIAGSVEEARQNRDAWLRVRDAELHRSCDCAGTARSA